MIKIIFCIIFLFMLVENSFSQIYDYRAYNAWGVYVYTSQNMPPTVRMSTMHNNGLSLLIDYFPNNTFILSLSQPTNIFFPTNNLYVEMRIDNNNIIRCESIANTDKGLLWLTIIFPKKINFIEQAISGNILRFKINQHNSTYIRFSLSGFTAAYNYAMELCRKVYQNYNDDEKYFREIQENYN